MNEEVLKATLGGRGGLSLACGCPGLIPPHAASLGRVRHFSLPMLSLSGSEGRVGTVTCSPSPL